MEHELSHYYFPPYITLAHMFHAPKGWAIHNREMTEFVLQYVVDGFARYPIGENAYETRRGDLLFHRPHERHSILTVDDSPYVCISLVFHFGSAAFPYDELFKRRHLLGNFADHPVETMLSQLVSHYRLPGLAHQLHCQSLLMRILAEAAQDMEAPGLPAKSDAAQMPKLVLIKNYLNDHYNRNIQMNELENVSGLSKNYILALFRKHVGMPPMQYLTWIRVNKAKELAIQTSLSVSEIAGRVGYADVHTFGRMFKKKTGQSLSQFCANLIYS
ncbi:helix-turn-helix domain-containing protein [Paenibacillus sp. GCM10023248]|uniref:helix-turn-helix domain-containing protein n=1 Tax=unclassified Paenibacillus TaxID=185978 RepID=UPI002378028D|nr:AraC family transcriptional regulator [Paenibacillus sp. MAHUQ-63]MDD9268901.1 AraC family transcriptional regulator [Paenibacillus sp. MAHUQ-63]